MKKKSVLFAVTNDISTDYRVHKIAEYVLEKGFQATVFGRQLPNTIQVKRNYHIHRKQLLFNHNFLFYAEYNIRLFFFLIFTKYDIVVANDLDTLPACYLASKIKKYDLIYDSHELFTEVPELQGRKFVQFFWKKLERFFLPKLKKTYTVSKLIAEYYEEKYGLQMGVVRNIPLLSSTGTTKKVAFPTKNKVILYQGVLNPGRGIEEVIKSLHFLESVDLVIIGYGKVESLLKDFVIKENLKDRVHFLGRIPREALFNYTKQADIGMVLEQPFGLSFTYSLPNKLFDFIHAEVPILSSNLPEIKMIVDRYKVGVTVDNFGPKQLAKSVNNLLEDYSLRNAIVENQRIAKEELCWEKEREKLDIYFKF